jgi:hypothetical protein
MIIAALLLAGCNHTGNKVRISNSAAVAEIQTTSRSEPIFYNGRTYQFDLTPASNGQFALKVSPMAANQEKDAIALATSSLGYYACVSGKAGKLVGKPQFSGKTWKMDATCS